MPSPAGSSNSTRILPPSPPPFSPSAAISLRRSNTSTNFKALPGSPSPSSPPIASSSHLTTPRQCPVAIAKWEPPNHLATAPRGDSGVGATQPPPLFIIHYSLSSSPSNSPPDTPRPRLSPSSPAESSHFNSRSEEHT